MLTTLGIVELQPAVTPSRENAFLQGIAKRRFGGKSLLEWVVRRVSDAQWLRQVIVVAPNDAASRRLSQSLPPDIRFVLSDAEDSLGRFAETIREFPCDGVVRLSVTHPFVDPVFIDRVAMSATQDPGCDYAYFVLPDGTSTMETKMGIFADWCRASAVLRADKQAKSLIDRQDSLTFIRNHPVQFQFKHLALPQKLIDSDLRLAIEDEQDWDYVQTIVYELGPESLDWQVLLSLNRRCPTIAQQLADSVPAPHFKSLKSVPR